jgi:signal transduction histidine kinase
VIICLGLLLALCLLGDGIAMLSLDRSIRHLVALAESHQIQSMRSELALSGSRIETDFLAARSRFEHDRQRRYDSIRRFEASLDQCTSCHHEPDVQAELDGLRGTFRSYRETIEKLASTSDPRSEVELERIAHAIADGVVEQTTAMTDRARHGITTKGEAAAASVSAAWFVLSATFVMAMVAGVLVAVHLARRLTQPVEEILDGIRQVRQGNRSYRFAINGDREFQDLGNAFNQAYASLEAAQESILQAEKMAAVGKLAAGVAHEVGNPLASISSVAQMMRRGCTNGEQGERIELIMKEVARTSGIVRDLLAFSRPARDEKKGSIRIAEVLDHSVKLLRYDKRTSCIGIDVDYDGEIGSIEGHSDRLIQVFTNIMINAVDAISAHNPDGAGQVSIRARRSEDRVVVTVTDDGPGMSPDQIHSAFDPFFTTKDPGKGTGLGLWICYQEVQRHRGTIRIESEAGAGTTVRVELPIEQGPAT